MHRTVRCANGPGGATVGCAWFGRRSRTVHEQWLSGGAPDCQVHHSTEGRNCLPRLSPMAPTCLGAIKGTPRRMEEYTKLSRNILRLPDSDSTHLIQCVSDLSSIWVANSVCCVSSSSLDLCAWLCCGFHYNTCGLLWHSHYVTDRDLFVIIYLVVTTPWWKGHRHRMCVLKDLLWQNAKKCHKYSDEKYFCHKIYDTLNRYKQDQKRHKVWH
jgi:hypothetical protein